MEQRQIIPPTAPEETPARRRRGSYKLWMRILAAALVIVMFFTATNLTNIDFTLMRYADSEGLEAARYLADKTEYLQMSRGQRLLSLLQGNSAYAVNRQAADTAIAKYDYERAARYLVKCLDMEEAQTELPALYTRLGCVYMLDAKLPEAGACFDQAIERLPDDPTAYLLRAQIRVNTGDTQGAAGDAAAYLARGGDDGDMLAAAMSIAEYAEDYETAAAACTRLIGTDVSVHQRAAYYAERGRYRYLLDDLVAAKADLLHAKALSATMLDGTHCAILGLAEMNDAEYAAAAEDFRRAGAQAQADNAAYYEQALVCAYLLTDYELLLSVAKEAAAAGEMTAQSWMLRGVAYFAGEAYKSAEYAFTRCLELAADTADAPYYRGLCRLQLGEYELAAEDFTLSLERGESALDCLFNRGLCRLMREDYERAAADFAAVIEDGSDPELVKSAQELLEPLLDG